MSSQGSLSQIMQVSNCIIPTCGAPLGHDSKEQGYLVCLTHRICPLCEKDLTATEVEICWRSAQKDDPANPYLSLDLRHARCVILTSGSLDPTLTIKQSEYDRLNAARLMVDPDMNLSIACNENNALLRAQAFASSLVENMSFDKAYVHLKMLEACVAAVNVFIAKQDRAAIKARASERESVNFKKAQAEALTSSRPTGKSINDLDEIELGKFMVEFNIKDRKVAHALKKTRDKAILSLTKLGIPMQLAITNCNADMLKNRAAQVPSELPASPTK